MLSQYGVGLGMKQSTFDSFSLIRRGFIFSTPPVFFVGSRGPILPVVFFAEFSSEIGVFVIFHPDVAFFLML